MPSCHKQVLETIVNKGLSVWLVGLERGGLVRVSMKGKDTVTIEDLKKGERERGGMKSQGIIGVCVCVGGGGGGGEGGGREESFFFHDCL